MSSPAPACSAGTQLGSPAAGAAGCPPPLRRGGGGRDACGGCRGAEGAVAGACGSGQRCAAHSAHSTGPPPTRRLCPPPPSCSPVTACSVSSTWIGKPSGVEQLAHCWGLTGLRILRGKAEARGRGGEGGTPGGGQGRGEERCREPLPPVPTFCKCSPALPPGSQVAHGVQLSRHNVERGGVVARAKLLRMPRTSHAVGAHARPLLHQRHQLVQGVGAAEAQAGAAGKVALAAWAGGEWAGDGCTRLASRRHASKAAALPQRSH